MQIPLPAFLENIRPWQLEVLEAFDKQLARFFLLRWHRRARKTTLILNLLIRECLRHANCVYGYIGPTYTQAKSIVWRDPNMLDRYLPPGRYIKNEAELYVRFDNKSVLSIKGADNPDSIRGQDYQGVGIDEWALVKPMVWEEILRPIISQSADRWAMFAFTPKGRNHAYDYWVHADKWPGWFKSFYTADDTRILPPEELKQAEREMPHSLFLQEFYCSFVADEEFTLIPMADVDALRDVTHHPKEIRRIISCDPSQGGSECVIQAFKNTKVIDQRILHVRDTMKIAGEIAVMMHKHHTKTSIVDGIGIGAGICDRLRELGKKVIIFMSSEKATDEELFFNVRTEIWWYLMLKIKAGEIVYPEDSETRREISAPKCKVINSSGKVQLEPKEKTRVNLGRSPDRADAFVMGIWGLKQVQPAKEKDVWRDDEETQEVSTPVGGAMAA